jgi:predicted NUDIX family NTP pyrophosphohydrolase
MTTNLTVKIKKYINSRAGLLMYRSRNGVTEILLAFPGGPWRSTRNKWEIPKGKVEVGEDIFEGAVREFQEETGIQVDADFFDYLGEAPFDEKENTHIWSFQGNWTPSDGHSSNTFVAEYPVGSGRMKEFKEVEQIKWFDLDAAEQKICPEQAVFLERFKKKGFSSIVINEDEPFQRAVKKGHHKMKMKLIGLGGNKKKEKGHEKPSFKRSKSAPGGFGGT